MHDTVHLVTHSTYTSVLYIFTVYTSCLSVSIKLKFTKLIECGYSNYHYLSSVCVNILFTDSGTMCRCVCSCHAGTWLNEESSKISMLLGSTVVSPYVGMARKQNGGYNGSISVQTPIFHLVVNYTRMKTLRSAVWRCPKLYITLRVFKNVAKVANLEAVKIQFRHLLFLSSSSFFSQPSASTRAIPKTKHPRIVVKFSWHVHFSLSF